MYKNWLKLVSNISENENNVCPNCGSRKIDYQYIGDLATKVGYLDVWCNNCTYGIHVSRVRIPEGVNILSFDDNEGISKRIPNFKQVIP